jgi:radical SAM superfamily enzyme YgiQ (UPF0313 family)
MLFIIPPYFNIKEYYESNNVKSKLPVFTVPYGVLSIAAYVKNHCKNNIEFEVLDLNLEVYKICDKSTDVEAIVTNIIREKMVGFSPDIVGISALFNTCYNYLELISTLIKKTKSDTVTIIGGGLATNLYKEVLNDFPYIDAACFGEGEIPICQLLDAEDMKEYFESNPSWITRNSLKKGIMPQYIFVHNLDDIPFFDYELIDLKYYTGRAVDKRYLNKTFRELSIHTSRGCPFNCVFCSNGKVHGKKVRYMSVEKVINEVEKMIELYNIEVLLIEDDHFLADKERARKILSKLSDFNIRIEFPNGMAVYAIDEKIGVLLKNAGVTTVSLAVESGSDYVLKNIINKPLKSNMIKGAVNILKKNGICVHAFIVIGLPGELEEHRNETMQMLYNVGFDWVYFFLAIPIAGSRLYDICKEKGYLINADFSDYITSKCNIKTPEIDPEYMEERAYLMNLEVNFVKNSNLLSGNYERAEQYFKNVIERYHEHSLAHFYIAKTYEGMKNRDELVTYHKNRYFELVDSNEMWNRYANHFNLL